MKSLRDGLLRLRNLLGLAVGKAGKVAGTDLEEESDKGKKERILLEVTLENANQFLDLVQGDKIIFGDKTINFTLEKYDKKHFQYLAAIELLVETKEFEKDKIILKQTELALIKKRLDTYNAFKKEITQEDELGLLNHSDKLNNEWKEYFDSMIQLRSKKYQEQSEEYQTEIQIEKHSEALEREEEELRQEITEEELKENKGEAKE
ncbi:MAG: hypothetical protein ACJAZX_001190, partial [Rickettsiales bacterium]